MNVNVPFHFCSGFIEQLAHSTNRSMVPVLHTALEQLSMAELSENCVLLLFHWIVGAYVSHRFKTSISS